MKKLQYILYALLIVAIIGLVLYDVLPDQQIETGTLTKAGILLAGAVLGIIRAAGRSQRGVVNKKAVYSKAYAEFIGTAFSRDAKLEKAFYNAVDDFYRGKYAAASAKMEKLLPECQNNEERYAVTAFQGLSTDKMGILEKALEYYLAVQQIRPNSRIASNMGSCYASLGRTEEAIRHYEQAIQLNPQNAVAYNNLAQHYLQAGDYKLAKDYAAQALEVNAKLPQALCAMAVCSHMLGNKEDYERYYRQAVSNGYDGKTIKRYIQYLDSAI